MSLEETTSETLSQNEFSKNLYKDAFFEAEYLAKKEDEVQEEKKN